jgi:RNA polymerase sigma-70 factor (ECF subfamily)
MQILDRPLASPVLRPVDSHTASLDWLAALYDTYHRQALGLAFGVLGDRAEAEDVVQEAFLVAWRARGLYDANRGSMKSWFLTLVRNRAIDALRARRVRSTEPLDPEGPHAADDDPARTALANLDQAWLGAAMAQLPIDQRRVVALAYFGGLTHLEIAAQLEIPLGTVKSRIRLGLDRLRLLTKEFEQDGVERGRLFETGQVRSPGQDRSPHVG